MPLLGYAESDPNGTQNFVFAFDDPLTRKFGYGFTTTLIHEIGHHLGLSHPHDGYDSTLDVAYGPGGRFYYTWVASQSNSIMSYIDLNDEFSQFDRDNMNRYLTASYLNEANRLLAGVPVDALPEDTRQLLQEADQQAGAAIASVGRHRYPEAAAGAKDAYRKVVAAAGAAGLTPRRLAPEGPGRYRGLDPRALRPRRKGAFSRFRCANLR